MSDDLVKQCVEELQDLVQCRCHDAYKGRGLHDPTCCCDYAEALKTVADRIEELESKLAAREKLVLALAGDKIDLVSELAGVKGKLANVLDALQRISLGSQNSMTTKDALGKEARAAIAKLKG